MFDIFTGAWLAIGYVLSVYLLHKSPGGIHLYDYILALGLSVFGPIWFYEVFRKND